jgi:hypothetical protein
LAGDALGEALARDHAESRSPELLDRARTPLSLGGEGLYVRMIPVGPEIL